MIFALITAWLAYKRAVQNGRNGILWALAGAGVFIGTQLAVTFAIGIFLGIGMGLFDWSESIFDDYSFLISAVGVVASFISSWLLLRYLDKVPDEGFEKPPAPPQF